MQVILIESVEKLGSIGDVVDVANGFGRNYLIPRKKAIRATKANLAYFEQKRQEIEQEDRKKREAAQEIAEKLNNLSIIIIRQAGEDGRLYGSVSSRDIANALFSSSGIEVASEAVVVSSKFKEIGAHRVMLRLHTDVSAHIVLNIARSENEAKAMTLVGAESAEVKSA